jgi:GTP-binding protein LepA
MAKKQLEDILAIPADEAILASAKAGIGIEEILEAVVARIPHPSGKSENRLQALTFDSHFDAYRGVVIYTRVFEGSIKAGDPVKLMSTNANYEVKEVGVFKPQQPKFFAREKLLAGDIGYVIANIKTSAEVKVGDTLTSARQPAEKPLPGFQLVQPMVFSGIYPINTADFERLKAAIAKLQLNDAAFQFMAESSIALGFGFRCGFLGLLHMEIILERLRREFDMDIIATYPSVIYEVERTNGEVLRIDNPDQLPDPSVIEEIREPMVRCFVMIPNEYISPVMQLIMEKRGEVSHTESIDTKRVMLRTEVPLNEILVDFVDKLKSITRGYG